MKKLRYSEYYWLLGLISASILITYTAPLLFSSFWYIFVILVYLFSRNEAFWLAYYFVISDGFAGFFGMYEATVSLLPGLPNIEAGQLYILATFVKSFFYRRESGFFHITYLKILFTYILFLVIIGQVIGISSLNVQFRVVKLVLPLLLLYSLPILMTHQENFSQLFSYLFPVALAGVFTQFFTVITGSSPANYLGFIDPGRYETLLTQMGEYRGFYNAGISLISFFAALYYLAKGRSDFPTWYLQVILIGIFLSVFISATRGWLLGLGITTVFFMLFALKRNFARIFLFLIIIAGSVILVNQIPGLSRQVEFATERFETMESIAGGDVTLGRTETRTTERSGPVMKKWRENPIFGWGFSDDFFLHADGHVGNQNILMHSGIIGALLIYSFFLYYLFKLSNLSFKLHTGNSYKKSLMVFPFFFIGWFIIHSTSGQQFAYYALPGNAILMSVFFTFGAINYREAIHSEIILRNSIE